MDALLGKRTPLFDRWHSPQHRDRLIGGTQLVLSASLLAFILMMYVLRPSAGAEASGTAVQPDLLSSGPTWATLAHETRAVNMSIGSAEFEEVPAATQERWATTIDRLAFDLMEAVPAPGIESVAIDAHVDALSALADRPTDLTAATVTPVLSDLIADLDLMASAEREAEIAQLELQASSAIEGIGWRMLGIAATAVAAAVGLVGLGIGLDRMSSSERLVLAPGTTVDRERSLALGDRRATISAT